MSKTQLYHYYLIENKNHTFCAYLFVIHCKFNNKKGELDKCKHQRWVQWSCVLSSVTPM